MSRKLIFASGLLICFGCQLDTELRSRIHPGNGGIKLFLVNYLSEYTRLTPLQVMAKATGSCGVPEQIIEELFSSYADFLAMLDNPSERKALETLRAEDSRTDKLFAHVRSISERFEQALDNIFFENKAILPLTSKYGVF